MNTKLERLESELAKNTPVTLSTLARAIEGTPLEAAELLGKDRATFADGADFCSVWEALSTWEKATLIFEHHGHIFEIACRLATGKMGGGYYNIMGGKSPVGGHLRPDLVAKIGFISLPFMGRESHFVAFFDHEGAASFSVYVGREKHQLIESARDTFLALQSAHR